MTSKKGYSDVQRYAHMATESEVFTATPHRLVQMLLEGALDKIAIAKGFIERNDVAQKNTHITWAVSIISGLRMSLDHSAGGDIASNLEDLYEYMCRRLLEASRTDDTEILDEITSLIVEIKSGWDAISETPDVASAATSGIDSFSGSA